MKLVKTLSDGKIYPLAFPQEIVGRKLTYFNEGYKKTTRFEILNDVIPDGKKNWLELAQLADKYGIIIGKYLASEKVAEIIAFSRISGYLYVYQKIKSIIPDDFSPDFFEAMKVDYKLAIFGLYTFDICAFDEWLSKQDSEYDHINCLYKGKETSMEEYISHKYGNDYVNIIKALVK